MGVTRIMCKSFMNRMHDGFFAMRYLPFRYTANPYRGCSHGCIYCFATRSHYYLGSTPDAFSTNLYVKVNCAELLGEELRKLRKSGKKSLLVIGNISDAYQPIETKYRVTRQVLRACLEYDYPCFVETKSTLILDDVDLIGELGQRGLIGVGTTVTSYDEGFVKLMEPHVPRTKYPDHFDSVGRSRILILKKLRSVGADTYLHITPYFPYVTEKDLEWIVRDASDAKVRSIIMAPLELTQYIWSRLIATLANTQYARLIPLYKNLYMDNGRRLGGRITTSEEQHFEAERTLSQLCRKHGVQYWAFTNPQFNTAKIGGIYRYGYPVLLSYYELAKRKGEISLADASALAKDFSVDNTYLSALQKYWVNGRLFEGVSGVRRISRDNKVAYAATDA